MLAGIELNPDLVPPLKLGLHIAQILFAFVIFCLEIAVFRSDRALIIGQNGWTFGVCFLSIPAWIYLGMAPRFPKTVKLANPYVMAVIDGLYTIIWLSAFSTQAAYNTANLCGTGCAPSKAIVGLGFFVCLFFAATTFISIFTVQHYKWHGTLPGYQNAQSRTNNIDPDKAAFSMAPHDEESYAPVGMNDHDNDHLAPSHMDDHEYDNPLAPGSQVSAYSDASTYGRMADSRVSDNPFQQHDNPFDASSEYLPQSQVGGRRIYAPPSVNDDYDDERPAHFPAADYDRVAR